jgi:alkylation response protein AidB-like acyl-CoA dehydrogenase
MAYPLSASAQAWQAKAREWVNRALRVGRIVEGASEIQRLIIARSVLKCGVQGVIGR